MPWTNGSWLGRSIHRAFAIDVLACPHCGGRLRLIATLHDRAVIRRIIDYVFRELAITYLGRTNLSHVPDEQLRIDAIGSKPGQGPVAEIEAPSPSPAPDQPARHRTRRRPAERQRRRRGENALGLGDGAAQGLRRRTLRRLRSVHDGARRHALFWLGRATRPDKPFDQLRDEPPPVVG